jgi:hypothetical protein
LCERLRLTTAHKTKARLITGTEYTTNINPIIDVPMDLSMNFDATTSATIMRTGAVQRSNRDALLKKIHQINIPNPQMIPPNKPMAIAEGTKAGMTNLRSHWTITMITPGQSRNGFS